MTNAPVADDAKWPKEAEEAYERVRPLGKGAFGLVWLAKAKKHGGSDADGSGADDSDALVAIKFINIGSDIEHRYADREIAILSELRHPCVIRLVRAYDPSGNSRLVVMSLAAGPDVGKLIELGGAFSLPLCRLLARHLIAAVSYLHGRGVVHRDIKPDNCILVRAEKGSISPEERSDGHRDICDEDSLWDQKSKDTEDLAPDWKFVLVDFGFARALTPADIHQKPTEKKPSGQLGTRRGSLINQKTLASSEPFNEQIPDTELPRGRRSSVFRRARLGESVARMPVRAMSAIGTRAFAAPEVMRNAREKTAAEKAGGDAAGGVSASALSETVADYGMISDAYSVGMTLRTALTGAPANVPNLSEYIRWQRQSQPSTGNGLFSCFGKKKADDTTAAEPRRRQFRHTFNIPKDIFAFVEELVNPKTEERLTARQAQLHPWICGRDDEAQYSLPKGDIPAKHGDPIVFLKCILDKKEKD